MESGKAGLKFNSQKTKVITFGPMSSWQIDKMETMKTFFLFSWAPKFLWMVTAAMKLKQTCCLEGKL